MTFALVTDNTIRSLGRLPNSARRLDTGDWVLGLADADITLQQACGYFQVVETPRPDPSSDTVVVESAVELVDGVPTRVWSERPKTPDELEADLRDDNRTAIERNLVDDLANIQAILDDTNANINTNPAARIKTICRMLRRLGRHALNDFTGTD